MSSGAPGVASELLGVPPWTLQLNPPLLPVFALHHHSNVLFNIKRLIA
jgi:hypothetical protein